MNVDDPRLTAYALSELPEREREEIEKLLSESPEAQKFVNETQDLAAVLQEQYRSEGVPVAEKPANLIDIRDDPWFSRARPLAIAAVIAILALLGAMMVGTYRSHHTSDETADARVVYTDVEPDKIPNPIPTDAVGRVERVVIGQLVTGSQSTSGELRTVEVIDDAFRIQRLRDRLTNPTLSKKSRPAAVTAAYELMFLDADGHVLAAASFYYVPELGFVLQPSKYARESGGHYFVGDENAALPGHWESEVDYREYVIPFPDWSECVGYAPGV